MVQAKAYLLLLRRGGATAFGRESWGVASGFWSLISDLFRASLGRKADGEHTQFATFRARLAILPVNIQIIDIFYVGIFYALNIFFYLCIDNILSFIYS